MCRLQALERVRVHPLWLEAGQVQNASVPAQQLADSFRFVGGPDVRLLPVGAVGQLVAMPALGFSGNAFVPLNNYW